MSTPKILDDKELRACFIEHLNRIYEAKIDIVGRLPSIAQHADFKDLELAIDETIEDINQQIENLLKIYKELGGSYTAVAHNGSRGMVTDLFNAVLRHKDSRYMRDMSILYYMQTMESIEACSFKILLMIANNLNNEKISQLLLENCDSAKEDRKLFTEINKMYLPQAL